MGAGSFLRLTFLLWPLYHLKIPVLFYHRLHKGDRGPAQLDFYGKFPLYCVFMSHYALNSYYVDLCNPSTFHLRLDIFSAVMLMCLWQKKDDHLGMGDSHISAQTYQ